MIDKVRLVQKALWLSPRPAEQQRFFFGPASKREALKGMKTCGVQRRHVPEPDDEDVSKFFQIFRHGFELVRRAEKERPLNLQDRHVFWKRPVMKNMQALLFGVLG